MKDGKSKHLDKVWGEGASNNVTEVQAFWEGNRATELSGATGDASKAFQLKAQDGRQGQQLDALGAKQALALVADNYHSYLN